MAKRGTRPARGEIDEAALRLLARHGGQILATARRHAVTPEDAEDAFQRGIEILLTKAPSTSEDELIPWLKTVVIRTFGRLTPLLLLCMERRSDEAAAAVGLESRASRQREGRAGLR